LLKFSLSFLVGIFNKSMLGNLNLILLSDLLSFLIKGKSS